jgi:hypothetical protein
MGGSNKKETMVMSIFPLDAIACCLVGSASGALSGFRYLTSLSLTGAVIGLILGIASYFLPVIVYVWCLVKTETRPRLWAIWQCLYFPLLVGTCVLAGLSSWFSVILLR